MSRSLARVLLAPFVSLTLTGAMVVLAGPAQADRWQYDDAVGDVSTHTLTDTSLTVTVVPEQANGDIVQVVASHTARKVTIALRTRVPLTGPFMISSVLRVPGNRFMMMSTRAPGFGGNELIGFKDTEKSSSRCRRMKRTMGADKTTVRVVIPRSCLGDPRWFRFSISLSTFNMFAESSYDDDGLATSSTLFGKSAMSPKVRR